MNKKNLGFVVAFCLIVSLAYFYTQNTRYYLQTSSPGLAYKIDRRTGRVWQLRYSEQTEIYETQKSETALPPKLITWKDFAESKGYSDAATEEQFKIRKDFFENILRKDPEFPKDEVASLEVERRFAELIGGAVSENNIDDRIQKALGNRAIEMVKRSKVIRSGFISLHK